MGPEFLLSPQENWPEVIIPPTSEVAEAELVKNPPLNTHTVVVVHNNPPKNLDAIIDCNRFGSFHKLLRVTTYVLKFAKLLKQCKGSLLSDPSPGELTTAELYWIQSVQGKAFYNEIQYLKRLSQQRPIRVDQFNLFLDKDLVLKCRGRIGNANVSETTKNPALLPPQHPFVNLLIHHFHVQVKHSGTSNTLSTLRERYWLLKGRQMVKQVVNSCTICSRFEGLPYTSVNAPELRSIRVSENAPFTNTGVDFAGPLYTRARNNLVAQTLVSLTYVYLHVLRLGQCIWSWQQICLQLPS